MTKLPKLPAAYKKFLKTHDGETEYIFDDVDGWRFFTTEELTEIIRVDRQKVMNIHQLQAFAKSVQDYVGEETEDQDGEPYALERLAAGFAIGDNNGDVIFLDPEDSYSVWLFHHDGADVERLADSFQEWLEMAVPDATCEGEAAEEETRADGPDEDLKLEIQKLNRLRDGTKVYEQLERLGKRGKLASSRIAVLQALLEYAEKGACSFYRSSALDQTFPLLNSSDVVFEPILLRLLAMSETAYSAIEAIPKVMGSRCYTLLAEFALDDSNETEDRAQAIMVLSKEARLPWTSNLPKDPGDWTRKDLPLAELNKWLSRPRTPSK